MSDRPVAVVGRTTPEDSSCDLVSPLCEGLRATGLRAGPWEEVPAGTTGLGAVIAVVLGAAPGAAAELAHHVGERVRVLRTVARDAIPALADDGTLLIVTPVSPGRPHPADDVVARAATAFVRSLALEQGRRRLKVNHVVAANIAPFDPSAAPTLGALGRVGTIADVAAVCAALLGPAGAYVTGQTIVVCGGSTIGRAA